MTNQLNSGSLSTLKLGEVLLTRFRKVSNGFISVELAEVKEALVGYLLLMYLINLTTDSLETLQEEHGKMVNLQI